MRVRNGGTPSFLADVVLVVVALLLALIGNAHADRGSSVTLHGRIEATEEDAQDGHFTIVPDGDGDYVSLSVTGYLVDWFGGSVGKRVNVTIEPQP